MTGIGRSVARVIAAAAQAHGGVEDTRDRERVERIPTVRLRAAAAGVR